MEQQIKKDTLNQQQQQAVDTTDGPVLILAGAGSGKTKVLVYRIANLISKGVSPSKILAITFTNKAAAEMRQRVRNLIGQPAKEIWLHTFHAFCARLLRDEASILEKYKPGFSVYDTSDCSSLVKQIIKEELDETSKALLPQTSKLISRLSKIKTNPEYRIMIEDDYKDKPEGIYGTLYRVYKSYCERMIKNNAMDFDDLLLVTINLLETNEWVRYKYQTQFNYVMVDEYQDVNDIQYKLTQLLCKSHKNICAVGDADQSIYSWRGANIQNILSFKNDYPNCTTIKLEQNYRSTAQILEAANHVISNNSQREEKRLWTNKKGYKPILYKFSNNYEEAKNVVKMVKAFHNQSGVPYNEIAILYRNNNMSHSFETELVHNRIPYKITGGIRLFEHKDVKDILAYLRLILNPYDVGALKRCINTPKRGLGDAVIKTIAEKADETNDAPINIITAADNLFKGKTLENINEFIELFYTLMDIRNSSNTCKEIIEKTIQATQYIQKIYKYPEPPKEDSKLASYRAKVKKIKEERKETEENLLKLTELASIYDDSTNYPDLEEFLNEMALMSDPPPDYDENGNETVPPQVQLMTLHASKGLEFGVVFLIGLEEGTLPSLRDEDKQENPEEERRLCYVGITRAKQILIMTNCKMRNTYGETKHYEISRFILEIPKELIEEKEAFL